MVTKLTWYVHKIEVSLKLHNMDEPRGHYTGRKMVIPESQTA